MLGKEVAYGPTYVPVHVVLRTFTDFADGCNILFAKSNFIITDIKMAVIQC